MRTNTTKTMLLAAVLAVALPATALLAQDNTGVDESGQTVITGRDEAAAAQGQMEKVKMMAEEAMSPEQAKMMAKEAMMAQASGNQFELDSAHYVLENSDNAQVKQVAQTIIKDHTTALKVLREQAKQAGVEIPEKPELNKVNQEELALLKKQKGKELNEAYVYSQDSAHLLTALYLTHFENASNPQLKAYAEKVLPSVKEHHETLHGLADKLSGYGESEAMPASGNMGNDMQKQNDMDAKPNDQEVAEYFKHAAQGGEYEIRTAKLVMQKSQNAQVKQIAQTIIDDHDQSQQMLAKQAKAANVDLQKDVKLDDLFQAKYDMLEKKSGGDFDRCYIFDAAAGHRMSLLVDADAKRELTESQPLQQFVKSSSQEQKKHMAAVTPVAAMLAGGYDFPEMKDGMSGMKDKMDGAMKMANPDKDANPANRKNADSTGKAANGPEEDGK